MRKLVALAGVLTVMLGIAGCSDDTAEPATVTTPSVFRDLGRWGPVKGEVVPECASQRYFQIAYDECVKLLSLPGGRQDIAACQKLYSGWELEACIGQNIWKRMATASPSPR